MEMRNLVKCSVIGLLSFLSLSSNVSAAGNFTLGDINNDGYITNNDRYSLNEYLSSTTRSISGDFNHDAADIDRDGMITENDSTILTRYLAGWEGYEDLSAFAVELEIVNLSVDQSMLMTGETVTISAESNRSAEELVYTADVYLDNTKIDSIVGNSILKYIPSQSGVYSFDVRIKDSVSGAESAWYLDRCVDVFPYWALKGIELSTTKSEVGSTVTFSAKIDGNSDGLEYQFTLYKDDKIYYENPVTNSPSFSFPVIEAGIYSVSLSVGDSYDYNGWHMFSDNVNIQSPATENPKLSVNYGSTLNVDELHEKDYDEVIINAKNTTIVWERLSTDATYEIYISGPNGYSVHFEDYTSNSYTIPASSLKPGYEYEVDLERYDSSGKRISSGWRYFEFTVFGAESILLEKAPEILVPVTRQTYLYNDLTVQWKKMNYATKYELVMQYNCGNKWHDVIKNQLDKNKTSYTFSKDDLHPGCEHRVYIYAYDALGNKLDDRNNFYIEGDESTCRLIDPVITSHDFYDTKSDNVLKTIPIYGDIAVTWDKVPAAAYYSLEIRDETTREYLTISGLDHIQNTEYNIPVSQLVSGRIYRVSVNAHHTDSCSRDSETMYFRAPYTGNRVLNPPKLVSHEFSLEESDPTVITKQDLTLEWEPVTAAVKYDINWYWLSDADYPDFYSYGKKDTTITIPSEYVICGEDEHYVLSIVAYDANGNTSSNEYYVRPLKSTIAAPVLLSPSFTKDSSADYPAYSEDDISILWGEVSGAVKYRVKLYDYYDGEWDEIWVKEDITNLTCVIPERELYSGGLFRIRITAYDKYGNGKISEPYYFQIGSSKYINLTRSDWEAPYEESHKYITVETAGDWTATASDSWIKLSQKSGEATTRIKVNVNANNGNFARSGSVTFKNSSGGYAVFSITQAPNNSSSTGALKITAPEYGSTADYGKITAKWSYNYDYAYFNVQLRNITTGKTVYENDTVINKTDTIPVSALAYGHTYQMIVSAYNASYVKVSESSSVFKVEDFTGSLPEEDDTDNPEIVEPEISVGENKIVLSGITDGAAIDLSDISLSWLNVINAEYYNVALRDITEYPDGTADDKIVKILDKTTRIQTEKISSSLLTRGHQYRVWVGAHTADKTLITGKSVTFTVKESVTSDNGTPSTDFDTGVLNLAVGEAFDFEGMVYANGGTLEQIRVTVREASTGNFCDYAIYDAAAIASFGSTSAFDLSNIYRISTGVGTNIGTSGSGYADAGSQRLELTQASSRYSINVYAKNVNGKMILLATKDIVLIAEPFVRIYDKNGNDLNGTTFNVGYSAFNGKTVYVEANVDISAWNDSSNAFTMDIVDTQYTEESVIYTYSIRGSQNPSASKRYGELRIYETIEGKVASSSVKWGTLDIVQDGNPNVEISSPEMEKVAYELPYYLKGYQLADQIETNNNNAHQGIFNCLSLSQAMAAGPLDSLKISIFNMLGSQKYEKEEYRKAILYVLENIPQNSEYLWLGYVQEGAKDFLEPMGNTVDLLTKLVQNLEATEDLAPFAEIVDKSLTETSTLGSLADGAVEVIKLQLYGQLSYFDLLLDQAQDGGDSILIEVLKELRTEYLYEFLGDIKVIGKVAIDRATKEILDWTGQQVGKVVPASALAVVKKFMIGIEIGDFAIKAFSEISGVTEYAKESMNLLTVQCIESLAASAYMENAAIANAKGSKLTLHERNMLVDSLDLLRGCMIARNKSAMAIDKRDAVVEQLQEEINELTFLTISQLTKDWTSEYYRANFNTAPTLGNEGTWYFNDIVNDGEGLGYTAQYNTLTSLEKDAVWEYTKRLREFSASFTPNTQSGLYSIQIYDSTDRGPIMIIRSGNGKGLLITTCTRKYYEGVITEEAPCVCVLSSESLAYIRDKKKLYSSKIVSSHGDITTLNENLNAGAWGIDVNKAGVEKILNKFVYDLQAVSTIPENASSFRKSMIAGMISQVMYTQTNNYEQVKGAGGSEFNPAYTK